MTTPWTTPTTITQYAEEGAEEAHISWYPVDAVNLRTQPSGIICTDGELIHISRSPKYDIKNKTYYLKATGFDFKDIPETISGIEVRIKTNRNGRATDDTVQLCLEGEVIGENRATLEVLPEKIYGNSTDVWEISDTSTSILTTSTFGVIIRFKSHPDWPHKDPVSVEAVQMRIH